jgi:SAM-dependent methyltransferase
MVLDTGGTGYLAMAEFHDLFMDEPWDRLTPRLHAAFGTLDSGAVIVDIGAGSGMGTRRLASQTAARIVALEPDLVMRSILLARVSDDPNLASRVSVIAGAVPNGLKLLPSTIHGFVCTHVLGHLSVGERGELFAWIAAHLAPDGVGLVTVSRDDADTADSLEDTGEVEETRRIGRHDYRAIHRDASSPGTYHSRYEVWDDGTLLRSEEFAGSWHPISAQDLRVELENVELELAEVQPGLVSIAKGPRA